MLDFFNSELAPMLLSLAMTYNVDAFLLPLLRSLVRVVETQGQNQIEQTILEAFLNPTPSGVTATLQVYRSVCDILFTTLLNPTASDGPSPILTGVLSIIHQQAPEVFDSEARKWLSGDEETATRAMQIMHVVVKVKLFRSFRLAWETQS